MAPSGESPMAATHSRTSSQGPQKPRRLSVEGLQRAMSDLSFELSREAATGGKLPPISEVEDAKCECCGMSEECTPDYIRRVREKFCGKWICGLCSEAVKEEAEKNGGMRDEALAAHTSVCVKFNRIGRTNPVLYQAEAMREMLRKYSTMEGRGSSRAKSCSPKEKAAGNVKKGGIARSSSCIPSLTREISERKTSVDRVVVPLEKQEAARG